MAPRRRRWPTRRCHSRTHRRAPPTAPPARRARLFASISPRPGLNGRLSRRGRPHASRGRPAGALWSACRCSRSRTVRSVCVVSKYPCRGPPHPSSRRAERRRRRPQIAPTRGQSRLCHRTWPFDAPPRRRSHSSLGHAAPHNNSDATHLYTSHSNTYTPHAPPADLQTPHTLDRVVSGSACTQTNKRHRHRAY